MVWHTMNKNELDEIFALGREQRGVEFKRGGSRQDKHLFAKVVHAAIGMANRRDGGYVIVGVTEDSNGGPVPEGVSAEDVPSWTYDDVANSIAEYTDPNAKFDLQIVDYNGSKLVVIRVYEFEDIPVLCKKSYPEVLRAGACYVRTRRKPETVEIPTQADMRDLLDLAVDKGVRRFIARAHAAGLTQSASLPSTDTTRYMEQQKAFLVEPSG